MKRTCLHGRLARNRQYLLRHSVLETDKKRNILKRSTEIGYRVILERLIQHRINPIAIQLNHTVDTALSQLVNKDSECLHWDDSCKDAPVWTQQTGVIPASSLLVNTSFKIQDWINYEFLKAVHNLEVGGVIRIQK